MPGMTKLLCYDITITVDRDGGHLPNPAETLPSTNESRQYRAAGRVAPLYKCVLFG